MAFTIPENLHPDLMPLAWLVGSWRGKGRGEYPNVPAFEFAQEVSFNHDGRPFLITSLALGSSMRTMKLLDQLPLRLAFGE